MLCNLGTCAGEEVRLWPIHCTTCNVRPALLGVTMVFLSSDEKTPHRDGVNIEIRNLSSIFCYDIVIYNFWTPLHR